MQIDWKILDTLLLRNTAYYSVFVKVSNVVAHHKKESLHIFFVGSKVVQSSLYQKNISSEFTCLYIQGVSYSNVLK